MKRRRKKITAGIAAAAAAVTLVSIVSGGETAHAKTHRPARVRVTYAKSQKAGRVMVKWKKVKGASKYNIRYAYNKKFKQAGSRTVPAGKTKIMLKAKSGKTIYLRVRAMKKNTAGKYSQTVRVKVKKSASALALKKDGLYHTPALKYGYRVYTGITPKLYSGYDTAIYIKTNSPDGTFQIDFYDKNGKRLTVSSSVDSYSDVNHGSLEEPCWTGSYHKVSGGYIAVQTLYDTGKNGKKVYPTGPVTVKIKEMIKNKDGSRNYYNYTKEMKVGTIRLEDTAALKKAWLKNILKKSGADQKTNGADKMEVICDYLKSHVKYSRCFKNKDRNGAINYIYTIGDRTTPSFVQMSYNSYTSPYELEYIGSQIGYPVRSMYGDYQNGTLDWYRYHYYAVHESDRKMYEFCPYADSGLISDKELTEKEALNLIPQINVKKLKPA